MKTYKYKVVIEGYIEAEYECDAREELSNKYYDVDNAISLTVVKDSDYTKDDLGYVGMSWTDFI